MGAAGRASAESRGGMRTKRWAHNQVGVTLMAPARTAGSPPRKAGREPASGIGIVAGAVYITCGLWGRMDAANGCGAQRSNRAPSPSYV